MVSPRGLNESILVEKQCVHEELLSDDFLLNGTPVLIQSLLMKMTRRDDCQGTKNRHILIGLDYGEPLCLVAGLL